MHVINALKSIFSRQGIPNDLHSDGGPQYTSYEFKEFVKSCNINHIISSPHYPRSNGMVKRIVQTVKNILKKADESGNDPYIAMLEYRNTIISTDSHRQLF